MAFPTPSLKPPELLLDPAVITPAPQSEPAVKETAVGVKTPIIVDARRLPTAHEFSKLPSKERVEVVEKIARGFGEKYGVDPLLSMAVVSAESSFNTHAVSRDGHASKGLMQLLDTTGAELHQVAGLRDPYTPFEPAQNMELGVKHLRKLHDFFSSSTELTSNLATVPAANSASLEKLAVAAFNAGEGRVASAQDRAQRAGKDPADYAQVAPYLPDSTQEYVERVMLRKEQYENRFVG
jgi:soluble lytic murein transglycosylase-like protein